METSVLAALITGAICVISQLIISSRQAGKTEGTFREALKSHSEDISDLKDSDQRQWREIGTHTADIGYLKGRLNGGAKAHGHS